MSLLLLWKGEQLNLYLTRISEQRDSLCFKSLCARSALSVNIPYIQNMPSPARRTRTVKTEVHVSTDSLQQTISVHVRLLDKDARNARNKDQTTAFIPDAGWVIIFHLAPSCLSHTCRCPRRHCCFCCCCCCFHTTRWRCPGPVGLYVQKGLSVF